MNENSLAARIAQATEAMASAAHLERQPTRLVKHPKETRTRRTGGSPHHPKRRGDDEDGLPVPVPVKPKPKPLEGAAAIDPRTGDEVA